MKDEAGIAYVGKENAEFLTYSLYSGTNYEKTVAVVGDSHAHVAYSGIEKLGKEMGFNTFMTGISGHKMMLLFLQGNYQKYMDILLEKPDIRLVFLIFRIRLYISGKHNFTKNISLSSIEKARKRKVPADILQMTLQDMVNKLRAAGKEVIIVGDNPELFANPRDYLNRPFSSSKRFSDFPVLLKQDVLDYQKEALALLQEIKGATVVSPIDVFCPADRCRVFDEEGVPFYCDDDHLSFAGSDLQAQRLFLPYLEKVTEKGKTGAVSRK